MKAIFLRPLVLVALLELAALPAFGQQGSIEGLLFDVSGRPASQLTIGAVKIGAESQSPILAITGFSGRFSFRNLPAGQYLISPLAVTEANAQRPITIQADRTVAIELRLPWRISMEDAWGSNRDATNLLSAAARGVINPQAARAINAAAARTINAEAAKTINPAAAATINARAAAAINPAAAETINPEAAGALNPEAARVLDPERARSLTREEAAQITPALASTPP